MVKEVWDSVPSYNFTQPAMNKLKATKKRLMKWSRSVFGDIHEEVEVGIAKPKHFRNILSSGVASSQLIQLEKEAYNRLSALCFYKKSIGSKNLV